MNAIEKMSEIGDIISNAISVAMSKKEQILKQFVNGILVFLILLILGCLDFAELQFHFEYLASAEYWVTVITKTVVGLLAFNLGINIMWDYELKKDMCLALAIRKHNHLILFKDKTFEYYVVHVFNPEEKKKAYISQINHQIYWLNRLARRKDRLLYSSDLPENQKLKKTNAYCVRRKELEDLKTEKYIEKNLDTLVVKYEEVDPTVFELEIDGSPTIRGTKTHGSVAKGRAKATSKTVMSMLLFSMFITVIVLELDGNIFADEMKSIANYILHCVTDVGIVLWQLSRGAFATRKIISSELTQSYVGRNKVLLGYIKYEVDEKRLSVEQYEKVIQHLKDIDASQDMQVEEYVEVSEEQLKKLQEQEKVKNEKPKPIEAKKETQTLEADKIDNH